MRILQVTDFYRPIIGGLERHVQTLSHELARRGHRVAVATLAHQGSPAVEREGEVRIYRLGGWHRALAPFYESADRHFHPTMPDPGVMAGLLGVLRRERPRIIHAHSWMLYSALPLAAWSGAKLVVTLHDYGLVCAKKTFLHGGSVCSGATYGKCLPCARAHYGTAKGLALTGGLFASSRLHGRVARYLAVSSAVAQASVPATGHPPRPITVVPTFIPDNLLDATAATPRPAFLPPDDGYLLFVGVLSRHKGLHVLLDAYAGLRNAPPLVLIGTPYGDAPGSYPRGVSVAHNVPHAEVMAAWAGCALGIVPSLWPDPCPQVAIEAMAAGKALVASATGGLPDLVRDGETGLLVTPGDAGALEQALQQLLDDPAQLARMGEAARVRAQRYRVSTITGTIEGIYSTVLAENGGGQGEATQ